jgi:hypothetical protein
VLVPLAAAGARRVPSLGLPASVSLAGLGGLLVQRLALNPRLALRLQAERNPDWYRTVYNVAQASLDLEAGRLIALPVTVRNEGLITWLSSGSQAVFLSYHWYDPAEDKMVVFEGLRTSLPADLPPGAEVGLDAWVRAPTKAGRYILQLDMVQEDVLWFSAQGSETGDVPVEVSPATGPVAPDKPPAHMPEPDLRTQPARLVLWSAGLRMWLEHPWLGVGPDNFRYLYGPYLDLDPFDRRIHANSLYVETLANTGLAGALALAGLMAALARMAWRGWQALDDAVDDPANEASGTARALAAGLLAGLAAFFRHGVADYFFEFTPTYGLFWLLAGSATGLLAAGKRANWPAGDSCPASLRSSGNGAVEGRE